MSRVDEKRARVLQLLREARPRQEEPRVARALYILLVVSIISTTLPHPLINAGASLLALGLGIAWWIKAKRRLRPLLPALIAASIITGCSGPLLLDPVDRDILKFCSDKNPCNTYTVRGVGILGFGLDQVTPEFAKEKAGFQNTIGVDRARGYGLVSMAWVTVYGDN